MITPPDLPAHLAERIRPLGAAHASDSGEFVLYWMHHAVRAAENPALDTARAAALALHRPLLVYQGLGGSHAFDSDRHHTFILEGARDAAAGLAAHGVRHVFHLGRDAASPGPLRVLAARAALVVTEDFPAPPFPRWTAALARATPAPVWRVDCACVLPMRLAGRPFARAFEFRRTFADELARRAQLPWPASEDAPAWEGEVGFEPLALADIDIAATCAACDIDHSIGPAPGTRGGTGAGERRWQAFARTGLARYDRLRNDPLVEAPNGVSRISAYLHHGHLSALRIARETLAHDSPGARKFADELLIWRELAHNFCFHHAEPPHDLHSLAVLPAWARETLATHACDTREIVHSRERLARGETGEPLWNLAQASLRVHGELHNNLRMTWGKALLRWSADPQAALDLMLDLNHRYALDGNDPNSYGGLLYCLGLFDRPFMPPRPVYGSIRRRSVAAHASRLDPDRYAARVQRRKPPSVAVVGAGIAGLAAARTLHDQGFEVRVFERARGVGGRAATRRAQTHAFDHGAQYFTARDPRFARHVRSWQEEGCVAAWQARVVSLPDGAPLANESRLVGVPGMNAVARHLARSLDVRLETRVASVRHEQGGWRLADESGALDGCFDALVLALAPQQAAPLLGAVPQLERRVSALESLPCWCVMAAFETAPDVDFDAGFVDAGALAWVSRDSSKPERGSGARWVLHATPAWSAAHIDDDTEAVCETLLAEFFAVSGVQPMMPQHRAAHRWRYARVAEELGEDCLWDDAQRLAVCGDWCRGSRVEAAFLSGVAAAGRICGVALDVTRGRSGQSRQPAQA